MTMERRWTLLLAVAALAGLGLALALVPLPRGGAPAEAEPLSEFADFQNLGPDDLATLQVKLTYVGPQGKAIPTVAFAAGPVDMSRFLPFRRDGVHYGNDDLGAETFAATTAELQAAIDAAGGIPAATTTDPAADALLSFMLQASPDGGDIGFEAILDHEDARFLLDALRLALDAGNAQGRDALAGLETAIGPGTGDADCDGDVDAVDALMVLRRVAALEPFGDCVATGNVRCDDDIDAVDALFILRHVAALPVDLPAACLPIG